MRVMDEGREVKEIKEGERGGTWKNRERERDCGREKEERGLGRGEQPESSQIR